MSRLRFVLVALLVFVTGVPAVAQFASGGDPFDTAAEAVRAWQARAGDFDRIVAASDDPVAMCVEYAALGQDPRLIGALTVNFDDAREVQAPPGQRIVSYSARYGDGGLARVRVLLDETNGTFAAERVQFEIMGGRALPGFFQTAQAGVLFILVTLLVIYWLATPSWLRRSLAAGVATLRQHRRTVIATVVVLYGVFALGSMTGVAFPECQEALATVIGGSILPATGIVDVMRQDNVPQAAAAIAYWNFLNGVIFTTFSPAVVLGLPAYIINIPRNLMLGVALAPVGPQATIFWFHVPTIIIELMAYALVTAGGGMLLVTVVRGGLRAFREGFRKLVLTLPLAFLFILAGAWYESYELLRLIPAFIGAP